MVSSLEIHSSRAPERQRCKVEWAGRSKRNEDEVSSILHVDRTVRGAWPRPLYVRARLPLVRVALALLPCHSSPPKYAKGAFLLRWSDSVGP